jgi:hypothetical protein
MRHARGVRRRPRQRLRRHRRRGLSVHPGADPALLRRPAGPGRSRGVRVRHAALRGLWGVWPVERVRWRGPPAGGDVYGHRRPLHRRGGRGLRLPARAASAVLQRPRGDARRGGVPGRDAAVRGAAGGRLGVERVRGRGAPAAQPLRRRRPRVYGRPRLGLRVHRGRDGGVLLRADGHRGGGHVQGRQPQLRPRWRRRGGMGAVYGRGAPRGQPLRRG